MTRCVFRFPEFVSCVFSAFLPGAISVISSIDFIATLLANIKNLSRLPSRWRDGRAQLNSSRFSQGFFFCFPLLLFASFSFHSIPSAGVKCVCLGAPHRAARRQHRCIILWQTPSLTLRILFAQAQAAVVTRQTQLISAWKNV